ncbi:DUF262 domain-containing protein [Phormidium sp. LEGE 05292]|uniref:DUF262 domain-containing protein n=1 Tax=[Phormidium] sp. LEGE 05292 TaxID=767427 RepID=UPI0018801CD7|nr:DUF262 domain-containing protein [Phormidium sp. LEGE 05292]MBE9227534.1 DUF262 domain-containing protein [Phormidium sp. LEGE 05292]
MKPITIKDRIDKAESQIEDKKQSVDYDTREFTIEYIVDKYVRGLDDDKNEIYVPEYQREFVWDERRQSRLIESIILGLPIPLIFVAEIQETGRLEIVDGSQRVRTLARFLANELKLRNLVTLDQLNGFSFEDFLPSRQRKLKNTPMRMIVLSSKADQEVRNDMFDRINTSSLPLFPMEKRKGIFKGAFNDFVFECSANTKFKKLCPVGYHFKNRQEEAELVLRFFAFSETYPDFRLDDGASLEDTGVERFLDEYLQLKNSNASEAEAEMNQKKQDFEKMLDFVEKTFPSGFAKYSYSEETSRPYFEAIAVGSYLALKQIPYNIVQKIWTDSEGNNQCGNFKIPIGRYQTHKPDNMRERIDYVKNKLINKK